MNGVLDLKYALKDYPRLGITWVNAMNYMMNHTPDAGSIA